MCLAQAKTLPGSQCLNCGFCNKSVGQVIKEMTDDVVLVKAKAAATWCRHATEHARANGGKPWRYVLIPHDEIQEQMTLGGLVTRHERQG